MKQNELYSYIYSKAIPDRGLYGMSMNRDNIFMKFIRKHIPKDHTIIDCGCGRANLIKWLIADGYKASGTEIANSLLEGELKGLPVRYMYYSDLMVLLGPRKYDVVISNDVLEHLQDEKEVKEAIYNLSLLSKKYLLVSTGGMKSGYNPFAKETGLSDLHLVRGDRDYWMALITTYMKKVLFVQEATGSFFVFGEVKK